MKTFEKESIIKDLEAVIMVSENKAAKDMLQNTIKFINKEEDKWQEKSIVAITGPRKRMSF